MALDVSRYVAWESIIYPDGGTCVPSRSLRRPGALWRSAAAAASSTCARPRSQSEALAAVRSFEGHSEAGLCEGLGNMRYADGDR